jgi:hypothetical protein
MRAAVVLAGVVLLAAGWAGAARAQTAHKAIVAGGVVLNPSDVIAVYRPLNQQGVAVYLGRPGQAIQAIVFRDAKEGSTVFNEIWDNQDACKDPGDDDARPLTRMRTKDSTSKSATLIANVGRIMAIVWESDRSSVRVMIDKLLANDFFENPNGGDPMPWLVFQSLHDDADTIVAAYRACVLKK